MVAMGLLEPHLQEKHPERNKVLNCLGSPFEPTIEISQGVPLQPGDTLMLCSDGIWGALSEDELLRTLDGMSVLRSVPELVRRSVIAGGRMADNATALAMRWESAGIEQEQFSSSTPARWRHHHHHRDRPARRRAGARTLRRRDRTHHPRDQERDRQDRRALSICAP
jgi:serine/threonine protein phosphatase PrpC